MNELAKAASAAVAASSSSSVDELTRDHGRLERLLAGVHQLVDIGEWLPARVAFDDWAVRLRHHLNVEEQLLFVPLERDDDLLGVLAFFRLEHRTIEQLLGRARDALETDDARRFGRAAADFAAAWHAHNRREELVLYPQVANRLSPVAQRRLSAALSVR